MCGSPYDRTKEEEMRWQEFIRNSYSETTKETDEVVDFRVPPTEENHEYWDEQTRAPQKCAEHRGKWSRRPGGQFSYLRSKKLRHCRENYLIQPSKPQNRETKNRECRSREEPQKSWIQFHGWFENPNLHNCSRSKNFANESLSTKIPKGAISRGRLSGFH